MCWLAGHAVIGVIDCLDDEACDVAVADSVDHAAPFAAGLDEPGEAQFCQVLADRGARCADRVCQCAHIGLTRREQP